MSILFFIKRPENSVFTVYDSDRIKSLTRLRIAFSHLNEKNIRCSFEDTLNPVCSCTTVIESTKHSLLYCQNFKAHKD